ncbi:Glu/Leu/Phe/Val dehydrogenase dimerization domain-containing protein [Qingshengfaniella alkalisoli]|uniref:Glu/Leu/Phe/Val dehydrogenase n=1 Tax=Qingshengfaniella alkalisoli TaxID=2599296 RepID=A0A5B8JAN2_9RHOB|nr:Glu/Leu/Phe/Val dehydrogenase dimerization domain-containing protein [Qingshengfaniella alkalisoli]QDY71230.1 Glu/Leu/Phe/Val dehydrogenase [Qingshengfaniella alkalisoli]
MLIERLDVNPEFEGVYRGSDAKTGLLAFVAIHSTALGPAVGGCRMKAYLGERAARQDAMRLARAMTYKNAAAGLPLGGGKAVICVDEASAGTPELMRAFGRFVEALNGRYITAEDVGTSPEDMREVASQTTYVAGLQDGPFASGDPSPVTAMGVFECMSVALSARFGAPDFKGKTIAVQGLGHVGMALVRMLHREGAHLIVADVNRGATRLAAAELDARVVPPEEIHKASADVFAPCALGGTVNDQTVHQIAAPVICGAANNQLAVPDMASVLMERGVLYCPDYIVNAGGIVNVAKEILRENSDDWCNARLRAISRRLAEILAIADREHRTPTEVANDMVAEILSSRTQRKTA